MKLTIVIKSFVICAMAVIGITPRFAVSQLIRPLNLIDLSYEAGTAGLGPAGSMDIARLALDLRDSGIGPPRNALDVLNRLRPDPPVRTRGIKEMNIYRTLSPSVVLVATGDGLGSGSLISSRGDILTNWHVVKDNATVAVVFKPKAEGAKITKADIRTAKVLKIDETSDLALLRVVDPPTGIDSIRLGDASEAAIGSDVHAIGHPTGEAWTYTRGVISQYRREYSWSSGESSAKHQADVIQTQTPINPGNSGGPLISDSGRLIGVNSFKSQGEGLNFAVSVDEVKRFIARPQSRIAAGSAVSKNSGSTEGCKAKELFRGRTAKNNANIVTLDVNCNGIADVALITPDDKNDPIMFQIDRNEDGKPDAVIFDFDRDDKWDFSAWDNNYDGVWDLAGYHPDGKLEASRYEKYDEAIAKLGK